MNLLYYFSFSFVLDFLSCYLQRFSLLVNWSAQGIFPFMFFPVVNSHGQFDSWIHWFSVRSRIFSWSKFILISHSIYLRKYHYFALRSVNKNIMEWSESKKAWKYRFSHIYFFISFILCTVFSKKFEWLS